MKIVSRLKTYFFAKDKCFIPHCKARCCADAPLPEDFGPGYQSLAQRNIYNAANIGKNSPNDNYNSVIYNTRPIPLIMIGHAGQGQHVYFFDKAMAKKNEHVSTRSCGKIKSSGSTRCV